MGIDFVGYLFVQSLLLVIQYAFLHNLPQWVVWFPSLIEGSIMILVIVIFIIKLIVD